MRMNTISKALLVVLLLLFSIFAAVAQEAEDIQVSQDVMDDVKDLPENKCIEKVTEYLESNNMQARPTRVKAFCVMLRSRVVKEAANEAKNSDDSQVEFDRLKERIRERIGEALDNLSEEELQKAKQIGKEKLAECKDEGKTVKECLQDLRILRFAQKAELFKQRTVQGMETARENFERLKERFSEIKSDLENEKKAFKEAVENEDEEATNEHAKNYLSSVADAVLNNLEKVKTKIQENDDLTQEEADKMVADIDEYIAQIQNAKEDLADAQTKDEIKAAGKKIVSSWNKMKNQVRQHAQELVRAATSDLYKRAEYLGRKLESALDKLAEKGYDVSAADKLKDDFDSELASAKENFSLAKQKLQEAKGSESNEELIAQAKEYLKSANEDMKNAHKLSKQIIQNIKNVAKDEAEEALEETPEDYYQVEEPEE